MHKKPRRTLFILLLAAGVVLFLGLALRTLILRDFQSYVASGHQALGVKDEAIGHAEVKFPGEGREEQFIRQLNVLVLIYSLVNAGLILAIGIFLSQRQTSPAPHPLPTAAGDSTTELNEVQIPADTVESAALPSEPVTAPDKVVPALSEAVSNAVADVQEPEPETLLDDPLEADDEDMQPLAGDPDRITRIVKGLDELAKAEALRKALQKQPLELEPFLRAVIEEIHQSALDKSITVNLECQGDLTLTADPDSVSRIMAHLLDNAVKAVKKSGTVMVRALAENERVVLVVEDTGTGIRKKALPHIFERFYRGSGSGIGLGLAIVKELVDACQGSIEVQSARGKGSEFTVKMPRA